MTRDGEWILPSAFAAATAALTASLAAADTASEFDLMPDANPRDKLPPTDTKEDFCALAPEEPAFEPADYAVPDFDAIPLENSDVIFPPAVFAFPEPEANPVAVVLLILSAADFALPDPFEKEDK